MYSDPLAYFITFRCHGTWLQGDERGWAAIGDSPDQPSRAVHRGFAASNRSRMHGEPFVMDAMQRECVDAAIREHCELSGWSVLAINVRTNHVHVVVSAEVPPDRVMNGLKAWSTRGLRGAGLVEANAALWSRHGSTRYLWNEADLHAASAYVVDGQGG